MSSKTKKRLFIALAGLLASSTAAVLVATPGTSGAGAQTSAQLTDGAGCIASIEGGCELGPLAWVEAPFRFDFAADASLASLSDVIGATYGESAQWRFADESGTSESRFSFADAELISGIGAQSGGGYDMGPEGHFQPDPAGAMSSSRYFNSLMSLGGGASFGGGSRGGSSPGGGSPGGSSPGGSSPDGGSPGGSHGGGSPGSSSPDGSSPGGSSPGGNSPGGNSPGGGTPGGNDPIEGPKDPVSVPEPGTLGMLAFGLALAGFMGRRRRAPI
jgi:hypothetical protein